MSEILRFRIARSPKRACLANALGIELYPNGTLSDFAINVLSLEALHRDTIVIGLLQSNGLTERSKTVSSPLDEFDRWLLCRNNDPSPSDLANLLKPTGTTLPPEAEDHMPTSTVSTERTRLADLLLASMLTPCTPDLRAQLTRLLTIYALGELFAAAPAKLNTRAEIQTALRWRTILLPIELYDLFDTLEFRRTRHLRAGFADLYVAREEWVRYELGEIAHIENVRAGELKERKLSRLTEQETTTTDESETTSTVERATESTDRFELSEETKRDVQMTVGVDAAVETSGQYGPTKVETHVGGSFDYSQQESTAKATRQVKESVVRAVSRIEQRVRQERVVRTLVRTESSDVHLLKNDTTLDRASIYRWVNKIKRVQVFRYRNRFLLEFQIPEPGAWWRWILAQPKSEVSLSPKPTPFTLSGNEPATETDGLTYDQITESNYQTLGARYLALGLDPPPAEQLIGAQIMSNGAPADNDAAYVTNTGVTVPDGYKATTWEASVQSSGRTNPVAGPGVNIGVGVATPSAGSGVWVPATAGAGVRVNGDVGNINKGTIPIIGIGLETDSFVVNLIIHCEPDATGLLRWKISTYEKLAAAYADMQRQHDEERRSIDDSAPPIADRFSPGRNQEIIRDELKKHVISMLTGVDFNGRPALEFDSGKQPFIEMEAAERYGPEIQFIEQAFEWNNLSYVLYPYLWAGRDRRPDIALIDGADPDFARFLRSGSARVVIPARPGFEAAAQLYANFGVLWGGGSVPAPNQPGYLSIAEEIKSMQRAPDDGERGESWEVTLPTSLVCLGDGGDLPTNASITLDPPPGRVLP